ncbi:hypothetical protein, partial [Spiroplasma endosymbiont of Phyllotreta cruciferae]|uniref:hypothetical protein n=1 Tax=Spiroplasma endosymbiont of Phyllotreta cruciferae TaxID=2886375 RepID=UPI00209EF511
MKKLLNLLSVLTISGTAIPTTIAASSYQKENKKILNNEFNNLKRIKRNNPPSLQSIITTINIGNIEINDKCHIIQKLIEINHPIVSRQDFIENIEFENINQNFALIHLRENIVVGNEINSIIPDSIIFTINFSTNSFTLSSIISNTNIGNIENNYHYTILQNLQRLNPDIISRNINLEIIETSINSATIRNLNSEIIGDTIEVNFTTNNHTIDSLIEETDLGELPDSKEETILNAIIELNPSIEINNINSIENITNNSATIYGNIGPLLNCPVLEMDNLWRPAENNELNNVSIYYREFMDSIEVFFTLNIYQTIKPEEPIYQTIKPEEPIYQTIKPEEPLHEQVLKSLSPETRDFFSSKNNDLNNNKIINKYNSLSKERKQQKLNEINQHYQKLSENNKKNFKDTLKTIGKAALGSGVSISGGSSAKLLYSKLIKPNKIKYDLIGYMKKNDITPLNEETPLLSETENSSTTEAIEMEPLLSESNGLTAAETLTTAEGGIVTTEEVVIGTEASTAVSLAPETLGLSLIIGGLLLAIMGGVIWWLNSGDDLEAIKHNTHNQYDAIEKYYKFLAHDQLKLDINSNEWNKIKKIYWENLDNYQEFKNKIKSEIINFYKADHSGWGGSINDDDL